MSKHDANQAMIETYKARIAYRDKMVATHYDCRRFRSWRGRLGDWLDKRALKLALDHLPRDGGLILDVPCGTGRITSYVIEAGYKTIAADIAIEMIVVAQDRLTDSLVFPLHYVQADAVRLPFRSDAFMGATAIRFMGHVPSATRIQVLRELARVTQGYIIADYCVFNPLIDIRRRVEYLLRIRRLGFEQSWTWQSIPRHKLESEFQAANLQAVRWIAKARFLSDAWMVLLRRKGTEVRKRSPGPA